jgi:phage anti-repressor protein
MERLRVIESGIVPVYEDSEERTLIDARELHEFLDVGKKFADWIRYRIDQYNFLEGIDYFCFPNLGSKGGRGGHNAIDYLLTIDMAKELGMVENNLRGRQVRRYFIECERRLRAARDGLLTKEAKRLRLQAKRIEIMERNARSRQAQILKSTAEFFRDILSSTAMQAIASEVTVLITGKRLIELPEDKNLSSAIEIEALCDIIANMVGRIFNEYHLKIEGYEEFVLDKSPYSAKQATTTFQI